MTKSQKIILHIVSTLGDTISIILKESCVEMRQCGGTYTGDHMFTEVPQNQVGTSKMKIKFCVVRLTGMQEGLLGIQFTFKD